MPWSIATNGLNDDRIEPMAIVMFAPVSLFRNNFNGIW